MHLQADATVSSTSCKAGRCFLQVVYDGLRSPTEFESTPVIAHVLQEYFLRLLGRYREFVQPEGTLRQPAPASDDQAHAGPSLQRISMSGDIRARPSFRHSPRAPGSARPGAADDNGYLRCRPAAMPLVWGSSHVLCLSSCIHVSQ